MKKIISYNFIMLIYLAIIFGSSINISHAQNTYKLLEPLPNIMGTGQKGECVDEKNKTITCINLETYVGYVFKLAIALAVFLAVVVLIYGGFEYMLGEAVGTKSAAKSRMQNAIYGLLGALVSYLILVTIDPRLVQINTNIPEINIKIDRETANFQKQLSNDLNNMSGESRLKVIEATNKIKELEKERGGVMQKLGSGTSIENENYVKELARIDQEIKENKSTVITESAKSLGSSQFGKIFDVIRTPQNYNATSLKITDEAQGVIDSNRNTIVKNYDDYAKQLDEIQEYEKAREVRTTKEFLLDQIKQEQELRGMINHYNHEDPIKKPYWEKQMRDLLAKYASPPKDEMVNKYRNYPDILTQYNEYKTVRANIISQTLKPP